MFEKIKLFFNCFYIGGIPDFNENNQSLDFINLSNDLILISKDFQKTF